MFNEEFRFHNPIRWGMVGGGRGSQIGYIHRCAATRDRLFQFMAGAFDIDAERGREFGENWGIASERCYADYKTMFAEEAGRPDGIQAVSIATPNFTHYEILKAALEAGLHAVCEKPLCFTAKQAEELIALAHKQNRIVGVTYGYTGAQMIHQARRMIKDGMLGEIRVIDMQFAHGYHSSAVEENDPGTKWRVTPEKAGPSYVLGDVGTHALFLAETMAPQLKMERLLCSKQSFVRSRAPLEDNAFVLIEYSNGAVGNLWASCINAGSTHQQKIRIVGEKASLEWWDEHPNQLTYAEQGKPVQILDRGQGYLYQDEEAITCDRLGGGHAEGLFEAWANLYHRFGVAMDRVNQGETADDVMQSMWFPNINDGAKGVKFVERCICSANAGSTWVAY